MAWPATKMASTAIAPIAQSVNATACHVIGARGSNREAGVGSAGVAVAPVGAGGSTADGAGVTGAAASGAGAGVAVCEGAGAGALEPAESQASAGALTRHAGSRASRTGRATRPARARAHTRWRWAAEPRRRASTSSAARASRRVPFRTPSTRNARAVEPEIPATSRSSVTTLPPLSARRDDQSVQPFELSVADARRGGFDQRGHGLLGGVVEQPFHDVHQN